MTISKDLFLAILSMDSYNRGYDSGVGDGIGPKDANGNDADGLGRIGKRIGNATVTNDANSTAAQASGFYAIAYHLDSISGLTASPGVTQPEYGQGDTIISYRGTNDLSLNPFGASDIFNGWVMGAGELTGQSRLALEFFASALNVEFDDIWNGSFSDVAVLTGHSLGGGLARGESRMPA